MSIVTNVIAPIIQLSVYLFMVCGVIYFTYRGLKKVFPNMRWFFKYKIFRYKHKDSEVLWCMDAIEKGFDEVSLRKTLLLKGKSLKRTNEMIYIFNQVRKKLKGGINT